MENLTKINAKKKKKALKHFLICKHICQSHVRWIFISVGVCLTMKTTFIMIPRCFRSLNYIFCFHCFDRKTPTSRNCTLCVEWMNREWRTETGMSLNGTIQVFFNIRYIKKVYKASSTRYMVQGNSETVLTAEILTNQLTTALKCQLHRTNTCCWR